MLDFLSERFAAIPATRWRERMESGEVCDERGRPIAPECAYRSGVKLYYYRSLPYERVIPFEDQLLFRDEHLVVADKPHFLPVTPGGRYVEQTLLTRLKHRLRLDRLQPLHRLDRDTAGIVLFGVQPLERDAYHALFRQRHVHKLYHAIAPIATGLRFPLTRESRLAHGAHYFQQTEVPGPANAVTQIDLLQTSGSRGLYALQPLTGQRHQLRVHMAALGLPIEGDVLYPQVLRGPDEPDDWSQPMQLLAKSISFADPFTGLVRQFESRRQLRL
mgnify:CR=1 FL=1